MKKFITAITKIFLFLTIVPEFIYHIWNNDFSEQTKFSRYFIDTFNKVYDED